MKICNINIDDKVVSSLALVLLDTGVKFKNVDSFYNAIARLHGYLDIPTDATAIEITDEIKAKIIEFCKAPNNSPIPSNMSPTLYPGDSDDMATSVYFDKNREWIELTNGGTFDVPAIFRASDIVGGTSGSVNVSVMLQNKSTGAETYKTISVTATATWKDIAYCTVQLKASSSYLYAYVSFYKADGTLVGTNNSYISSASYNTYYYKFGRINSRPRYNIHWFIEPMVDVDLTEWCTIDDLD